MTTYKAKSVVISRKPADEQHEEWSAFIGLFRENNPHLKAKAPFKVIEIPNIEKVRIRDLFNISYYLRGNDIVINNLVELSLDTDSGIVTLTGKQNLG